MLARNIHSMKIELSRSLSLSFVREKGNKDIIFGVEKFQSSRLESIFEFNIREDTNEKNHFIEIHVALHLWKNVKHPSIRFNFINYASKLF